MTGYKSDFGMSMEEYNDKFGQDALEAYLLGFNVETWIKEDAIGAYLFAKAHEDIQESIEQLIYVDPTSENGAITVAELQRRIRLPKDFIAWIEEAIRLGRDARQAVEERQK